MACARDTLVLLTLTLGCGDAGSVSTEAGSTGVVPGSTSVPTSTGDDSVTSSASSTSSTSSTSGTGDEPGTSSTTEPPPEPVHGLRAEIWKMYLDPVVDRVDETVDFDWTDGAPAPGAKKDRFSIRWTGQLVAPETGTYTLITENDDGIRVWIDDALVIDDWKGHLVTRNEAAVDLTAEVPVDIRIDYFEIALDASMRLKWSSAAIVEQVIPAAHMLAAATPSGLQPPKPPFKNPVEAFNCPDPGVLGVEDDSGPMFYKVCTGGKFPIHSSRDLVLWTDTGAKVLPNGKTAWSANGGRNWAPELHRVGDQYVAYFTAVNGNNVLSIGAAYASDPLGPYTEVDGPLVQDPLGVIDATYVEDDGKPYMIYKIDGNSQGKKTPMFIRPLAPNGLKLVGEKVQVLVNDANTWEGGVVEAPWVVARDGFFYLFYSGNVYDHRYRTGVARATSVLGPYEKLGPPILANNNRWVGPGHGSVVTVEGLDYFVYHAWPNAGDGTNDGAMGRHDLVDRIVYEGGWPKIADGSPSHTSQAWPGVP